MEPRLKTSKKWTPLPSELVEQIESLFTENFAEQSSGGRFLFEGRIYPGELLLRLGYLPQSALRQNNFELSIDYNSQRENLMNLIHMAVDATASLFADWLEDEENKPSTNWQEFSVQNKKIYARYSTLNTELEAEADRILGEDKSSLVVDEDELEEQLKQKISILGLEDDEE